MEKILEMNDVCKEVFIILSYLDNQLLNKIPNRFLEFLTNQAADSNYEFYINPNKDLDEQDISEESKDLLSLIYYSYIADENQKKEILKIWNETEIKYQEELSKKYNLDNIFNKETNPTLKVENIPLEKSLAKSKKGSLFNKLSNFVKKLFYFNK